LRAALKAINNGKVNMPQLQFHVENLNGQANSNIATNADAPSTIMATSEKADQYKRFVLDRNIHFDKVEEQ